MLKARLGDSGLAATVDEIGEKLAERARRAARVRPRHPPRVPVRARRRRGGRGARGARAAEHRVRRSSLDERLPAPVEAAAYFVIAEGLTNVVRYAETRNAAVQRHARCGGEVVVVVTDDGKGGATLRGRDRPARPDRPARGARRAA